MERGGGVEVQYLPCIRDLVMPYKVTSLSPYPSSTWSYQQSWEVCRGRRRVHRTKAVPSPTSPLLHNTPKAGKCLGQSSSWTMLGCGPTLVLSVPLYAIQPFSTWRRYCWVYAGSSPKWWVERPSLDSLMSTLKILRPCKNILRCHLLP